MVYEPDHFLIASYDSIHVDYETRTLYAADHACFEVSSCVKSYYVQVSIKGAEYVSSATASLSGMGGSVYLRNGQLNEADPVAIGFTLNPTQERIRKGEVIKAYTTFNTFGKLVGQENYLTITFDFYTRDGRVVTDEFRITDLFETDLVKVNQWIILDKVIVIDPPPPSIDQEDGGGMDPDVEEWVNVEGDIYL